MARLAPLEDKDNWKVVSLPSTESLQDGDPDKAVVTLDCGPRITADYIDAEAGMNQMRIYAVMLARRIKDWNFKDGDETVPITVDSIKRMQVEDITYLGTLIEGQEEKNLSNEQKKTSISTSQEPTSQTTSTTIPVIQSQ
jgi:hypothetical protein